MTQNLVHLVKSWCVVFSGAVRLGRCEHNNHTRVQTKTTALNMSKQGGPDPAQFQLNSSVFFSSLGLIAVRRQVNPESTQFEEIN